MSSMLQQLLRLTYLELDELPAERAPGDDRPYLQDLQLLTRLRDLRLVPTSREYIAYGWGAKRLVWRCDDTWVLNASMLSGAHQLTRLQVTRCRLEICALAGTAALQHLELHSCRMTAGTAGLTELLFHLQPLQSLTYLGLRSCLHHQSDAQARPADDDALMTSKPQRDALTAAYSALTASSRLQHLDFTKNFLPAGVWEHIFPAGRHLPELRALNCTDVRQTLDKDDREVYCDSVAPLQGTRLVSCCPGLQYLNFTEWECSTQLLAPLQGLSDLRTLLATCEDPTGALLEDLCQLTCLRELNLTRYAVVKPGMLQLSRLKQLTCLVYSDKLSYLNTTEMPAEMPVWRRVVQMHLDGVIEDEVTQQPLAAGEATDSDSKPEPDSDSGSDPKKGLSACRHMRDSCCQPRLVAGRWRRGLSATGNVAAAASSPLAAD